MKLKYKVERTDGVNKEEAVYVVLRIDKGAKDVGVAREAAKLYSDGLKDTCADGAERINNLLKITE